MSEKEILLDVRDLCTVFQVSTYIANRLFFPIR